MYFYISAQYENISIQSTFKMEHKMVQAFIILITSHVMVSLMVV